MPKNLIRYTLRVCHIGGDMVMEAICYVYAKLIKLKKKQFEQIPPHLKADVKKLLEE